MRDATPRRLWLGALALLVVLDHARLLAVSPVWSRVFLNPFYGKLYALRSSTIDSTFHRIFELFAWLQRAFLVVYFILQMSEPEQVRADNTDKDISDDAV